MATELPTPEEIAELRRLHEQTTTWYFGRAAGHAFVADDVSADSEARIASVGSYADAVFIAAMRNHLPSLLDAAERVRDLEDWAHRLRDHQDMPTDDVKREILGDD